MIRIFTIFFISILVGCSDPDLWDEGTQKKAKLEAIEISQLEKEFMYGMIWLLVDDNNDSFTGWVKESYSSQSLQKLGYLKKGQKQGLWLSWHENGNIESKIEWEEDRLSGLYKHWYKNGVLHALGQTIDGEMDGEWFEYYSNSQLQAHSLNQMGKCVWKKIWRKNGEICTDSKLENGNGFFYEYYENGDAPQKRIFQNGVEIKFSPN
ncbi:MAG: hypothetical protein QNL65_01090 [Opitutales bacterium]